MPIVLFDREGWLVVVEGPADVAAAIEANDVEAGEYVGLDVDGRVLALSVRHRSARPGWRSAQKSALLAIGLGVMISVLCLQRRSGIPMSRTLSPSTEGRPTKTAARFAGDADIGAAEGTPRALLGPARGDELPEGVRGGVGTLRASP